ncbi:hypothetical protein [Shewanella youngdeokensis]|uniref:Outer membrane protein beta-barrel domain-containing protein n=1 Tax=Shewanella youngdeokensis TaxID=2999068 RepID=A0ABZ0K2J4_9GAMM|nr:hypothetical protein RGE70_08090 [Shewanella sp. DAU334]
MKSVTAAILLLAFTTSTAFGSDTDQTDQTEQKQEIDMSDPTSVFTAVGLQGGTNGMQVFGQFGYSPENGRKHMGFVEYRNDDNLNNYRMRYFTPGASGLGVFADVSRSEHNVAGEDVAMNTAMAGLMQVLPINDKITLYPSLLAGSIWSNDKNAGQDVYNTTTIITLNTYATYAVNDKVWLMLNPVYTYGIDGEDTRDIYLEFALGYRLSKTETVRLHASNGNDVWFNYTQAF